MASVGDSNDWCGVTIDYWLWLVTAQGGIKKLQHLVLAFFFRQGPGMTRLPQGDKFFGLRGREKKLRVGYFS